MLQRKEASRSQISQIKKIESVHAAYPEDLESPFVGLICSLNTMLCYL